jgi:hypothetical protein
VLVCGEGWRAVVVVVAVDGRGRLIPSFLTLSPKIVMHPAISMIKGIHAAMAPWK